MSILFLFVGICYLMVLLAPLLSSKVKTVLKTPAVAEQKVYLLLPFRNESHNLHVFFHSLKKAGWNFEQWEFIGLDDGSTDGSAAICKQLMRSGNVNGQCLSHSAIGKKRVLHQALETIPLGAVVFCADADVCLSADYFPNTLNLLRTNDMVCASVIYQHSNAFLACLANFEQAGIWHINTLWSAFGISVAANGAALAFIKGAWLENIRWFFDYPSGDDLALLRGIQKSKGLVFYAHPTVLHVISDEAPSYKAMLSRRARWLKKPPELVNIWTWFVGLTIMICNGILWPCIFMGWNKPVLFLFPLIKLLTDLGVLNHYLPEGHKLKPIPYLAAWAFYPFHILFVLLTAAFKPTLWKTS